jgi:uncharacterized protein (TIGR03067 family)
MTVAVRGAVARGPLPSAVATFSARCAGCFDVVARKVDSRVGACYIRSNPGHDAVHSMKEVDMKLLMLASLGCGALVSFGSATLAAADPDLQKLQGKWIVESFSYNGNPVELLKDATREFKEEKYTLTPKAGDVINGAVKLLDSTKLPKQVDLEVNGQTLKGIYEVDGEMLNMCYNLNNPERPTEFVSKPDSGIVLVVHKRVK